ncbi:MAG: crotonase/enoyl-CoA hydratase family protein [Marinicella pacifica]
MSERKRIECVIKNQVAYVSLARPDKRNALDMAMFQALDSTMKKLRKDRSLRAVILTGQGEDFCSGLDVKSVMASPKNPLRLLFKWLPWRSNLAQRVSTGWRRVPVPVIAAIQGRCWGGGLQIVLGADFRMATADATFSIMEGRWGLIPDMGGSLALSEHCRADIAKELTMTAKIIKAEDAQRFGLITHIHDNPLTAAEALVAELVKHSPDAVAGAKKLFNRSWTGSRGMALFRESWYQIRNLTSKNNRIKIWNQTHEADEHKAFKDRKRW